MNEKKDELAELEEYLASSLLEVPNLQLPSPELRDFYKDESQRIIWIRDTIEECTLNVVRYIMLINKIDKDIPIENRKPIRIFIDTPGGSVAVMWAIINAIKISKTPVYTINFCECLSAGAHILAAGHKRFGMPGSTVLIHSGSCGFSGNAEQVDNAKKYYDAMNKKSEAQLLQDTAIEAKVFKKKAPFDWYLDTDDALKYKVIDKVVTDFEEII